MDINRVLMIGRLVRDADLKYTDKGTPVSEFSIANNRKILRQGEWIEEVYYIDCTLFGRSAEALAKYLKKGKQVAVEGELKQSRWTDKVSNENKSKHSIYVNLIQLLGTKGENATSFDDDEVPWG